MRTFFKVYNELGTGFLEGVYREALFRALKQEGLDVEKEEPIPVYFRGELIGKFFADIIIARRVIVEIKVVSALRPPHTAQLIHYLRATPIEVGLLLNFGPTPDFKRYVYHNAQKKSLGR